jgi:hypothetical protein
MNYYFLVLLLACSAYALIAGGTPERIGATIYALSCFITLIVLSAPPMRWLQIEVGVLVVDVVTFILFCALALRSNRFWPIWVSSLLGLGVLGHLGRWAGPDVFWWAYAVILSIWSYPILAIIAIGTWNHQRRLKRFGTDPSWSSSSARSDPPQRIGPTG